MPGTSLAVGDTAEREEKKMKILTAIEERDNK